MIKRLINYYNVTWIAYLPSKIKYEKVIQKKGRKVEEVSSSNKVKHSIGKPKSIDLYV